MQLIKKKTEQQSQKPPRRKLKKKALALVLVALVVMVSGGIAVKLLFFNSAGAEALTATTTYGSLAQTLEGTGITLPAESYSYTTASDTEILEVLVSAGDTVSKGDLLYVQDDSEVDEAIDDYQDQIDDYEDQITTYQDQLSDLRQEMAEVNVKAPIAGQIQEVKVEAGDEVKKGDVLCTVMDSTSMTLTQYFSYTYESQIYLGQSAVLSIPDLMTNLAGVVTDIRKVERVTTEGTKCFAVTVTVPNPNALSEGMAAGGYLVDGADKIYPAIEGTLENQGSKTVTAKCSGEVKLVHVEDYQTVSSGAILIVVDDSDYQTQLKSYSDQITRAQERIVTLRERVAEEEESRANYSVTSDIDGKVVMVRLKVGDTPQKGQNAVAVYDLTKMSVSATIDELDIEYLSAGMTVRVVRAGAEKDEEYTGTITEVGMEATSTGGVATFPVTIEIDSDGALSAGVNVSYYIDIGSDTEEGVLAPVDAVQYTDEGTCLFVHSATKPENAIELEGVEIPDGYYAIPVEVGTSSGKQVKILSGAEEGMTVFLRYQQSAPSNGSTTSEGTSTESDTGMPSSGMPSDFGGGMPGGMSGGMGGRPS